MKRGFLLALVFILTVIATEPPAADFDEKLSRFHRHYNQFLRSYLGCPKDAAYVDQCKPNLGTFDWSEFNYARREAGPLFDIERKN